MVEGANDISGQSGTLTIEGFSPSTAYDVEWHVFGTLGVLTIQQSNGTSNGNGKIDLSLPTEPQITKVEIIIGND